MLAHLGSNSNTNTNAIATHQPLCSSHTAARPFRHINTRSCPPSDLDTAPSKRYRRFSGLDRLPNRTQAQVESEIDRDVVPGVHPP